MKKAAAICMTLAMVVSLSAGFTSLADDQTALERVLEKGKLVVCLVYTSPSPREIA